MHVDHVSDRSPVKCNLLLPGACKENLAYDFRLSENIQALFTWTTGLDENPLLKIVSPKREYEFVECVHNETGVSHRGSLYVSFPT